LKQTLEHNQIAIPPVYHHGRIKKSNIIC
jgi:hypothetical protein